MKAKTITIFLLVITSALIVFLAANRFIIGKNMYGLEDNFLGMKFINYRYSIMRFAVYMPLFFILIFIVTLFLRSKAVLKYSLLICAIIGFVLAWKAYDYFAPW